MARKLQPPPERTAAPPAAPAPPDLSNMPPSAPPPVASGARNGVPAVEAPPIGRRPVTNNPPKLALNAVEGFGKTTIAAYAPNPFIIMAKGETGYDTLLQYGRVPHVDSQIVDSWPQLFALLDALKEHKHRLIGLDALGGFETLCHEYVCNRDYKGVMGDSGFLSFQQGPKVAATDWLMMLAKLDELNALGKCIFFLSHSVSKKEKDPFVPEFDKYIVDCNKHIWSATAKWCDAVFFGRFVSIVDKIGGVNKGIGGSQRMIYTEGRDTHVAKNRFGMPPEIEIPNDPSQAWQTIRDAIGNGAGAK